MIIHTMVNMFDLFSLKGKTAIVTGANTGLGQGICLAYAKMGANVVGISRRSASETKELCEKVGAKFLDVRADLSSTKSINYIIEEAIKAFGHVDILVNNAGIIKRNDAMDVTEEEWDSVIDVNQKVVFFLSQAFAKACIKNGNKGKIINIASMLSYQGGIRVPAYCASKSAILGLTRALCNEWASKGINVNGIAPGYMETNNTTQIREDQKRNEAILERIPQGRWGTPADLEGAAIFLASDASDYVNGFTIAVDGGWLAR